MMLSLIQEEDDDDFDDDDFALTILPPNLEYLSINELRVIIQAELGEPYSKEFLDLSIRGIVPKMESKLFEFLEKRWDLVSIMLADRIRQVNENLAL